MISKVFTFLILAFSNILLYQLTIVLEPQPDYRILFTLIRAVFVTSMLMQLLTASGVARAQKMW